MLLAARLRRLIDDGDLPAGMILPPDRSLAAALAVGRSTVIAAYDLLRAEGRILRRQGSGTRVAGPAPAVTTPDTTSAPIFLHLLEPHENIIMLACAAPDTPPPELTAAYQRAMPALAAVTGDIGYHPTGHAALRAAVAERYTRRGVPTRPDQILITTGAQQALSLLARAVLRPGDRVLVEAPSYAGALEAFREEAAVPHGLPVGLVGFDTAVREHSPALAYVIPAFHNPTGAVVSPLVRRRLAEASARTGVPLIEDEALVDLGFPGAEPGRAIASYSDSVISVGSLSKLVWGGLRVGWVRAAQPVIARLARLRAVHDLGGNIPAQLAAAELLPGLEELRTRLSVQRQAQHDHLRAELAARLPDWEVPAVRGGQSLWIRLPYGDGTSFAQAALRHGVAVLPGIGLDTTGSSEDYLRVQFLLPQGELSRAAQRLAQAWQAYVPPAGRTGAAAALAV